MLHFAAVFCAFAAVCRLTHGWNYALIMYERTEMRKQTAAWQKKRFADKRIDAKWDVKTDRLFGDEQLLEMLLRNIFENAFRATDEYGKINTYVYETENETVFKVEDNGCGMNQEEIEKIKEPFYRVDKSRSRKQGGTGLGVSLCQKIVEKHDGTLEYSSQKGVGTTVTVRIPIQ